MEKRRTERVQCFQMETEADIQPVWVFRKTHPDAILGLLLDIAADGAQVLTDKAHSLADESSTYRLVIQTSEATDSASLIADARCAWSKPEGTLYIRNGLFFENEIAMPNLLAAKVSDTKWLRCELLPIIA